MPKWNQLGIGVRVTTENNDFVLDRGPDLSSEMETSIEVAI